MSKPRKSQLPVERKPAPRLERLPVPVVPPPARTQHTNININADAHLVIRELRKLLVVLVVLIVMLVGAI